MTDSASPGRDFDVLIVGAGLSGIDAAYRLQTDCPGKTYAILEARDAIGGTWDLFRYPGIRSDSDMYTLGFPFRPWRGDRAIADGAAIRDYIADTARAYGIDRHIRFGRRVVRASWSSAAARWTLDVAGDAGAETLTCRFLYMGSGYYDYDRGHRPDWPGLSDFAGTLVHPQHWPEGLDHDGKRVVVIGSGATAVTLVPALARTAAQVTMLQRSPSYIVSRPSRDGFARMAATLLPEGAAGAAARWKNILLGIGTFTLARRQPDRVKSLILKKARSRLPEGYEVTRDFSPDYAPWDQRVCLVPDADLFTAIRTGKAAIVTDRIDRFVAEGVRLESGRLLPADIVVTATGLTLKLFGGVELIVDGLTVRPQDRMVYKGMMLEDVPNLALAFGYTNASWTLKCDLTARYACRLIRHMDEQGQGWCVPRRLDPDITAEPLLHFTSGYVRRAAATLPHQGSKAPWRVHQNYLLDLAALRLGSVEDGVMQFGGTAADAPPAPVSRRSLPRPVVAAGVGVAAVGALALFAAWNRRRVERLVPADGGFVALDGVRLHCLDRGSGPAIVMIHGLGGQMRNFSHGLLDRLAGDHRVILIDRPGSGYSQAIGANNVRAQAAVIAKLLERLEVDRPLVVGHSLGGAVALALALDHPARVGGLALIAPLTQVIEAVPPAFRGLAIQSAALRRAAAWTIATPATLLAGAKGRDLVFAPDPVPADFATRGGGALVTRPATFESASADMAAANLDLPEMMRRYPTLTVPLGILYGRGDRILDLALHGERLAAAVPGAELTLIEGGHMIPLTKPDAVAAWIRGRAASTPS